MLHSRRVFLRVRQRWIAHVQHVQVAMLTLQLSASEGSASQPQEGQRVSVNSPCPFVALFSRLFELLTFCFDTHRCTNLLLASDCCNSFSVTKMSATLLAPVTRRSAEMLALWRRVKLAARLEQGAG